MIPAYQIKTYTGAVLDYTITSDCKFIHIKDVINDIGSFSFSLPVVKGATSEGYNYTDIALHDIVKFYFWYSDTESVPANPQFVGRICKITGSLDKDGGFNRVFEGKLQTEILERRFKINKRWQTTDADAIVTDIANDLSLGLGDIAVDGTHEDITVRTEKYSDILKRVSDYWTVAATVKKDWYVDADNDLVWKARGTAGTQTLTVGTNIIDYSVMRDVLGVKNKIYVYGALGKKNPTGEDDWTEALTNWTATTGTLSLNNVTKKVGSWSICCTPPGGTATTQFKRTFDSINIRDINTLKFWRSYSMINASTYEVRLHAPNSTNYFTSTSITASGSWVFCDLSLGPNQNYDVDRNPTGIWTVGLGSPNWWDIQAIEFYITTLVNDAPIYVDVLYFEPVRFYNYAENAASQTSYGLREAEFVDDTLLSDTECQQRAEALLFQLKDPITRIDINTNGNTNILIGDRISMTIPAEAITPTNYDVVSVEHNFYPPQRNFTTKVVLIDSANTRQIPPFTNLEVIQRQVQQFKESAGIDRKHIR